jgi:plastocyanin
LKATALAALAVAGALLVALPASAATPTFKGTVGPGFTITMASKPKTPGKIKLVIADKSSIHNFHLTGPGVNVKTSVSAVGSKTFTVTLKKGTYKFVCDPHASSMKGSFKVK